MSNETVEAGLGVTLQSRWALSKLTRARLLEVAGYRKASGERSFHVLLWEGDLRTQTLEVFLQTLRLSTEAMLTSH
jgi:hypothetical protein